MSNDSKDELTLRIGEKLTAARIESGYTQSRAARAVGSSQSCISAVEHGKKQNVNIIIALIKPCHHLKSKRKTVLRNHL